MKAFWLHSMPSELNERKKNFSLVIFECQSKSRPEKKSLEDKEQRKFRLASDFLFISRLHPAERTNGD
jgi:hypothetical protein